MKHISKTFLNDNLNYIYIFADNINRRGTTYSSKLRYCKNTYGFILKKFNNGKATSIYNKRAYETKYKSEVIKLKEYIKDNPDKIFIFEDFREDSANRYEIVESIIIPNIQKI